MIQRIQSVYLFLGAAAAGSVYALDDLWTGPSAETATWFTPTVLGLLGLSSIGALIAIFLFGDRNRQRSVVQAVQIVVLLAIAAIFLAEYLADMLPFTGSSPTDISVILSIALPVVAYLFFYLARRGIDKDIKLIRSMDRLR